MNLMKNKQQNYVNHKWMHLWCISKFKPGLKWLCDCLNLNEKLEFRWVCADMDQRRNLLVLIKIKMFPSLFFD